MRRMHVDGRSESRPEQFSQPPSFPRRNAWLVIPSLQRPGFQILQGESRKEPPETSWPLVEPKLEFARSPRALCLLAVLQRLPRAVLIGFCRRAAVSIVEKPRTTTD